MITKPHPAYVEAVQAERLANGRFVDLIFLQGGKVLVLDGISLALFESEQQYRNRELPRTRTWVGAVPWEERSTEELRDMHHGFGVTAANIAAGKVPETPHYLRQTQKEIVKNFRQRQKLIENILTERENGL